MDIQFSTDYLNKYMALVEDTESPRIFHIWSAIFDIAAALGRRCYLPFGAGRIYPNHYILLVGTPGTRKSSAASMGKRLLKASTGVRFAPSDTGGQRQGLLIALQGPEDQSKEFLGAAEMGSTDTSISSLTQLAEISSIPPDEYQYVDVADKHHLAIIASEFSRIIGQNNMSMMDFLGERYDGEDYEYHTKGTHIKLKDTLINMLACTTPVSIANSLPPQAGGQGFLSRIILVYGARKYKQVARPMPIDPDLEAQVKDIVESVYQMNGEFTETPDAEAYAISLYGYRINITDSRFAYYAERRYTHLLKLAMCLCATRGEYEIQHRDYEEAHRILIATEYGMPDALGEFGLNPLAMLKQQILEHLRENQGPLAMEQITALFHRDARTHEIMEVVNDLTNMRLVKVQTARTGGTIVSALYTKEDTEDQMMQLLVEKKAND